MDILDDMGVSKLSAKVFFLKVNYSFSDPDCCPHCHCYVEIRLYFSGVFFKNKI